MKSQFLISCCDYLYSLPLYQIIGVPVQKLRKLNSYALLVSNAYSTFQFKPYYGIKV